MPVVSNTPEGYQPFEPNDRHILNGYPDSPPNAYLDSGLYYRSDSPLTYEELSEILIQGSADNELKDYQYWAESAWKTQQGTGESALRYMDKLAEEHEEFKIACDAVRFAPEDFELAKRDEAILEAGDVLWCIAALACNGGADIDAGLRSVLFRYVRGIKHYRKTIPEDPYWRDAAASLAVKSGQLTFMDLDTLFKSGFEPTPSQVMNTYWPDEVQELEEHYVTSVALMAMLGVLLERQYAYTDDNRLVMNSAFNAVSPHIGEISASLLLETLYVAKTVLPEVKIGQIISKNVSKISQRVKNNQVDKSDGNRS